MATCLLLPGWSFSPEALAPLSSALRRRGHRVLSFDLEEALERPLPPERLLDETVLRAASLLEAPAVWVGWSLGGLFALRAAQRVPERVEAVVLLATAPRFLAAPDWPGIDPEAFGRLYRLAASDPAGAVRRFHLLTAPQDRPLLRRLARAPLWSRRALLKGLELLERCDLRPAWRALSSGKLLWAEGERLFPPSLLDRLRELHPALPVVKIASHHLFPLTCPGDVAQELLARP